MTDIRDFRGFGGAPRSEDATPNRPGENGRRPDGKFAPGNRVAAGHGRPPAPREAALYAAALEGLGGPEGVTEIMRVVREKALGGSAPHATIAMRVSGLYREDAGTERSNEAGEALGAVLSDPSRRHELEELLDDVRASLGAPGEGAGT